MFLSLITLHPAFSFGGDENGPSMVIWTSRNKSIVCVYLTQRFFRGLLYPSLEDQASLGHLISDAASQLGVENISMASNPSMLENIYYGKDRWLREDICLIQQQHFALHFQIRPLLENDLLQEQFIKLNTCHYAMQNS